MSYVSTLEITTVSRCSLACTYCPQDKLKAAYQGTHRLTYEDFACVLAKLPSHVRIHFSGMVEPWLNDECTDMLSNALANNFRVAIYTTLHGMKDPQWVADMLTLHRDQVDVVCVHLPDAHGNMTGHRQTDEWLAALRCFRELEHTGGFPFEWMSMGQSVVPVSRLNAWEPNDRAGSRTTIAVHGTYHRGPIACSYTNTYSHNVLLPNGDVVVCCNDYALRHPLGNLLRQSYEEILDGPEMQRIRAENAKQEGHTICRRCNGARAA